METSVQSLCSVVVSALIRPRWHLSDRGAATSVHMAGDSTCRHRALSPSVASVAGCGDHSRSFTGQVWGGTGPGG